MMAIAVMSMVYLGQLWVKVWLAVRLRRRALSAGPRDLAGLTVVQAVLSGDTGLEEKLSSNLAELSEARFIWVVDRNDACAVELGEKYARGQPAGRLQVLCLEQPPQGANPKLWKLAAALPSVETAYLAVVDDDTRLSRGTGLHLLRSLDAGAMLATGCPTYEHAAGVWSGLTAEFVNTASALTYLPAASCFPVRTINGMGYAMRTAEVRNGNIFESNLQALTDDLAVARAVVARGGRIEQCPYPLHVSTTVDGFGHYCRLMHRWFVFTRLLFLSEPRMVRAGILFSFGLHPLLLLAIIGCGVAGSMPGVMFAVALMLLRAGTLGLVNRWLSGQWRHSLLASLLTELVQPIFLVAGCVFPVIRWRHRRIRVHEWNHFEYLPG